jgi:hypothetical protein
VVITNKENPKFGPYKRKIENKKLEIVFDRKTMDEIYDDPDNASFLPEIKVLFAEGQELKIPYELKVTQADIKFEMALIVDLEGVL